MCQPISGIIALQISSIGFSFSRLIVSHPYFSLLEDSKEILCIIRTNLQTMNRYLSTDDLEYFRNLVYHPDREHCGQLHYNKPIKRLERVYESEKEGQVSDDRHACIIDKKLS